jgi:hypothetical protein
MLVVGRLHGGVLRDRDAELGEQRKRLAVESRWRKLRRGARRSPCKVSGEGVGAGFRRAEGRDAFRGEQRERALGMVRE